MTQNPYAQFGGPGAPSGPGGGFGGEAYEPGPRRTSVLAIVALVLSLICFIPGAGALAVILGGTAIVLISQSRGRLGGLGMAVTAVVLGLLFSLIWIGIVVAASRSGQMLATTMAPADQMMAALDKGDLTNGRSLFTPAADAAISDQTLTDFVARYQAEAGHYQGVPVGLMDMINSWSALSNNAVMQGRNDMFPVPAKFDKGNGVVLLQMDTSSNPNQTGNTGGGQFRPPVVNIAIVRGPSVVWLIDPQAAPSPTGTPARPGTTPPRPSGEGDADEDAPGTSGG